MENEWGNAWRIYEKGIFIHCFLYPIILQSIHTKSLAFEYVL